MKKKKPPILWIYGDSYATDYDVGSTAVLDKQWHRVLASRLDMKMCNLAYRGSSLEWLYHKWYEHEDAMSPGDVAVIALTDFNRRWLLINQPQHSTVWAMMQLRKERGISLIKARAMELYFKELWNPVFQPALLRNWLYSASLVAERGCKVIILPAFPDVDRMMSAQRERFPSLDIARGRLLDISVKEHVPELREKEIAFEGRPCHLSPENHLILVQKIINCLDNAMHIDLTEGFCESIIDGTDLDSPDKFAMPHRLSKK